MLFTFLILAFGYIFNADVCESKFNMKEFLSNPMASIMKPITYPKSTYGKSGFSEPELFQGGHLIFFLIYGIDPAFFQGGDQEKKTGFAETENFLGFETQTLISQIRNQDAD